MKKNILLSAKFWLIVFLIGFVFISGVAFFFYSKYRNAIKFHYSYKQEYIDKVYTTIRTNDQSYIKLTSYDILLKNQSNTSTTSIIATGSDKENLLFLENEYLYENPYEHTIDYNIGKVEINIIINIERNSKSVHYSKTWTCYTKGEDNYILFYSDDKCKNKMHFELTDPSVDKLFCNLEVNVQVKTKYMNLQKPIL